MRATAVSDRRTPGGRGPLRSSPALRSRTETGVDTSYKTAPGTWRDAPVPCNPVSDAEIAKRYPQFTFDR